MSDTDTDIDADQELDEVDEAKKAPAPLRVAGREVELEQLKLLSERWDILVAYGEERTNPRVEACALGLAWRSVRRRLPPYRGDVLAYGGLVMELLLTAKKPASFLEIRNAGIRAVNLIVNDLAASKEGMKEAEDF
jgi:hypothetical protein